MKSPLKSAHLALLLLFVLANVQPLKGDQDDRKCTQEFIGEPTHYFDDYTLITYDVSCGDLCPLPLAHDLLNVTRVKVFFSPNDTQVNCSWIVPGYLNDGLSTVMYFEQSSSRSVALDMVCGESSPSLTLWDEYSSGGDVQTSYTICRDTVEDRTEAHSRRSSRLGNFDTLITLTDYDVQPETNPMLLKYITVDWSQICFKDYRVMAVGPSEKKALLGSQWFTSNLRLPNRMHCRWKFSAPASSTDMIRVRLSVNERTVIEGSCVRDDYVLLDDGERELNITLCDDSHPYFFSSFAQSVYVDFHSGHSTGAPEFEMSYSTISPCPSERLYIETDLTENAVYVVVTPGQTVSPCRWTLYTNWTNNVVMLSQLLTDQGFQHSCSDRDYLDVDLGTTVKRIELCEVDDMALPMWSAGQRMLLDFHATTQSSRRVSLLYKSVPRVAACQGLPARLQAVSNKQTAVMVDMTWHRTYRDVTAADCHWLVSPSSQLADADRYAAELVVSDFIFQQKDVVQNITTAAWMTSGFRAYAGVVANATALLRVDCKYSSHGVHCRYLSASHTLLLVYDPGLSISPFPLKRISLGFREVVKKASSGQAGSVWRSAWHAHLPLLCVVVVLRLLA